MTIFAFNTAQKRYNVFLTMNNITISIKDKNGNTVTRESNGKYSSKIRKKLKLLYNALEREEEKIKILTQNFSDLGKELDRLTKLRQKLHLLYRKYVLKQDVDPLPVNIKF